MGAGKIKFEHLGKTKDLAVTSTETKDGNIAFLKPNRNPGPPWHAPRGGSIDLSQLHSTLPAGFVLPVAGPAIGKTTLRPSFASSANSLALEPVTFRFFAFSAHLARCFSVFQPPNKTVILRGCDFIDLFVSSAH